MLNGWVLSRDRKTASEGAEVTRSVRLFQTRAAATGKARSPTVWSRVRLTINDEDELERSRWRDSTSATWQSSSVRYAGADPCRHLYTRTACLNANRSEAFSVDIFAQHSQYLMQTILQILYPVVHPKSVLYVNSISLMLKFYSSAEKIIRIRFTSEWMSEWLSRFLTAHHRLDT